MTHSSVFKQPQRMHHCSCACTTCMSTLFNCGRQLASGQMNTTPGLQGYSAGPFSVLLPPSSRPARPASSLLPPLLLSHAPAAVAPPGLLLPLPVQPPPTAQQPRLPACQQQQLTVHLQPPAACLVAAACAPAEQRSGSSSRQEMHMRDAGVRNVCAAHLC